MDDEIGMDDEPTTPLRLRGGGRCSDMMIEQEEARMDAGDGSDHDDGSDSEVDRALSLYKKTVSTFDALQEHPEVHWYQSKKPGKPLLLVPYMKYCETAIYGDYPRSLL
jgi:hypothetical protein